jgi:universal stress protein E
VRIAQQARHSARSAGAKTAWKVTDMQIQRILVVADSGVESHGALERASRLARRHGAALRIVDIVPEHAWPVRLMQPDYEHIRELYTREKQEFLDGVAAPLRKDGLHVTTKVLYGRSSVEIIREVLRERHDLVVKEAKGRRSRRIGLFGTTALRLLRHCPCDVWLNKPGKSGQEGTSETVLAAVDASPGNASHAALNRKILDLALAVSADGVPPHVVFAWQIYGEDVLRARMNPADFARLEQAAAEENQRSFGQLLAHYDWKEDDPHVHLLRGDPPQAIQDVVRERAIDVLVMGTVARTGIVRLFLGNTAESLLEQVECSLLATKPEGFISSVHLDQA